ncbi:MAG: o-succinylbenzoate synthase [Bacteroidota bacterium]
MRASYKQHILQFKRPSGTSRGVLLEKETWFIILEEGGRYGIGECGLLRGLSIDDTPEYEARLKQVCDALNQDQLDLEMDLKEYPSIRFGLEQAKLSLAAEDPMELFPSDFLNHADPISINGLIWMGEPDFMLEQLEEKLKEGFQCIKMKIGAITFAKELEILESIRRRFDENTIELRVDANGAFLPHEALDKLDKLSRYHIHSIEQPIRQGQWQNMRQLCEKTPIPIALDEELIGVHDLDNKAELLGTIKPQYIILKPSLLGGFQASKEWITLAEQQGIDWWVTSALESNVGLNAIAQWTYTLKNPMPQGLGTGGLYTNNFDSPLEIVNGQLRYNRDKEWSQNLITELCT